MKYKIFLNNPNRKWEEDDGMRWLCINNTFSMPYHKDDLLIWPTVNKYMKEKYGLSYDLNHLNANVITNLTEDPLANKTGNQVVASGNEEVEQQVVQANA